MIELSVLYENEEILIINKPSGLAVQGGSGIKHSVDTLLPKQAGFPIYLVHRLDKDTSGILVTAKSSLFAAKWTKLIASKEVKKEYEAFCIGRLKENQGWITETIEQKGAVKDARTQFRVKELYEQSDILLSENNDSDSQQKIVFSLIALKLETGRMHQIRIHLAKQQCPIAADDKYGNFKLNKELKKSLGISKLMLHAKKIDIPLGGSIKTIEIGYPPHMADFTFSGKLVKVS